jgi:hypothetical protein
MKKYLNRSGKSGVKYYEIGKDYIKVWFIHADKSYLYNYIKPGKEHVKKMKTLAMAGKGLSTYISQHVGENYFR